MGINTNPIIIGTLFGNQLVAIIFLIVNLYNIGFERAFAVYGFTSMVVIYPTLIIYFIYKFALGRKHDES